MDYAVTRNFKWRWFTPVVYIGSSIAIVLLVLLNIPLTGYDTITVFLDDFNATTSHWYNNFMPFIVPDPGTMCGPVVFNTGDSFTTNYSSFEWRIDSILRPTAGDSSIAYKGSLLTDCDVTQVYLDGNLQSWNMDFTVIVTCTDNSVSLTAKTQFSASQLPGRYAPVLGSTRLENNSTSDDRGAYLNGIIKTAALDLGKRAYSALLGSNYRTPVITSLQANFEPCPASVGNASCALNTPGYTIPYAASVFSNATVHLYTANSTDPDVTPISDVLSADVAGPIDNILQAVYAAVRVDLGNQSPNNFILHPSRTNVTLTHFFAATPFSSTTESRTSQLYEDWDPENFPQQSDPVTISGPAHIQVAYPCQIKRRKQAGSLVIAVLVATLSMFSSGWAIFMILAVTIAKKGDPNANICEGCRRNEHDDDHAYKFPTPMI